MISLNFLNPLNKEEEKRKFFFDVNYNPQFRYPEKIGLTDLEKKYGIVSNEFLPHAQRILDMVIKKHGTESAYLAEVEGRLMTKDEITLSVQEYLKKNNIESKVKLRFVPNMVSPCSMEGNTLNVRLPIASRLIRFDGTLNHEIGTHYFRRLNEEKQVWYQKHEQFDFQSHLETEEGLAVLHSHLFLEQKHVWFAALYYVTVYQASQKSFSELFAFLRPYVDNRDRRWNIAMRAKRGVSDTSVPGAMAKDQVYVRGMMKVLHWLEIHDYDPSVLYLGKIAIEDLERARTLVSGYSPVLPSFLNDREVYKKAIKDIKKQNML